jgi:hypothetical protein
MRWSWSNIVQHSPDGPFLKIVKLFLAPIKPFEIACAALEQLARRFSRLSGYGCDGDLGAPQGFGLPDRAVCRDQPFATSIWPQVFRALE